MTRLRLLSLASLAAATTVAAAAPPALAAPGDLDPAFGTGGLRLFGSMTAGYEVARTMLVQPDGKLLIAGSDGSADFLVRRLDAGGAPDRGFGGDGTADADFATGKDTITAIALQDDGKVVAAGKSEVGIETRTVVARFSAAGVLDPSFGPGGTDGDGRVTLAADQTTDVRAVAALPGGGIALSGATYASDSDFAVTRLLENGAVDLTYEPVASPEGDDRLTASARTADGKLLVGGQRYRATAPGQLVAGVARYRADGKLDRDFGTEGVATIPGMSEPHTIVPVAGGILIAGADLDGDEGTVLARLDQKGQADTGFGSAGLADVGFPGADLPAGMSVLGDGRILVAVTSTELAFGAVRLSASGRLDAGYGEDGIAIVPVGDRAISTAAAATTGGAFVLAGPALVSGTTSKLAVARLQGDPPPRPSGGPGPGPDPLPQPAADTDPPALSALQVTRRIAGARPRIRFTLSEPARVRITLKRRSGRVTRFAVSAGAGTKRLRAPRRLARGRYRLTAVAVDAAGNTAAPVRLGFRVRAAT